jgi:hypothetical protein
MISNKEIKRVIEIQIKKKCIHCKIGNYVSYTILNIKINICDNCGKQLNI